MSRMKFYADMLERTAWTFVQGFAGGYIGGLFADSVTDLPTSGRLAIAAGAGIAAVMKSFVAPALPWTASNSASMLPEQLDPPAPTKPAAAKRKPREPVARDDGQSVVQVLAAVALVLVIVLLLRLL